MPLPDHNPELRIYPQPTAFTTIPVSNENNITKARYKTNRFMPKTILTAPRFVIFVDGPVSINAAALPMLIPS